MIRFIVLRVTGSTAVLLLASLVIYGAVDILPGDAATAYLGREASPQAVEALRHKLGLDRPFLVRYVEWLWGIVRGDLGTSVVNRSSVTSLVRDKIANTAVLALVTLSALIPLSLILGVLTAIRRGRTLDTVIQVATLSAIAVPEFVVGVGLILLFVYLWPGLPAVSLTVSPQTLVMPVASLLVISVAYTMRMVRAGVIGVLQSEYVAMARLKGLPERLVILRHVLRNSLVPAIQALALTAAWLPGGIVVIEYLFAYPGMGSAMVEAINARDNPTVQALGLILTGVYVLTNLASDILAVAMTPRLRRGML